MNTRSKKTTTLSGKDMNLEALLHGVSLKDQHISRTKISLQSTGQQGHVQRKLEVGLSNKIIIY